MKQKNYTVTVIGSDIETYNIEAKNPTLARQEAERRFKKSFFPVSYDRIESRAVADWHRKEDPSEN